MQPMYVFQTLSMVDLAAAWSQASTACKSTAAAQTGAAAAAAAQQAMAGISADA